MIVPDGNEGGLLPNDATGALDAKFVSFVNQLQVMVLEPTATAATAALAPLTHLGDFSTHAGRLLADQLWKSVELALICPPRVRALASARSITEERLLALLNDAEASSASAADVARRLCLSRSHCDALARHLLGGSVAKALVTIRLKQACMLLASSSLSVKQVCFAAGFKSAAHFTHQFKARFGQTPSAFRRTHR